jgi:hypothetical protein
MRVLVSLLVAAFALTANAAAKQDLKLYLDKGEAKMAVYDILGNSVGAASVKSEEWSGDEVSKYIVRWEAGSEMTTIEGEIYYGWVYYSDSNSFVGLDAQGNEGVVIWAAASVSVKQAPVGGQFVTGLKGYLEKFDVGGDQEQYRLVFRNSKGQFVTWLKVEDELSRDWNVRGGDVKTAWYEVRWDGKVVNAAKASAQIWDSPAKKKFKPGAFTCFSNKICPALTIRDTESGHNNGKILTSVSGSLGKDRRCYYHVPSGEHAGTTITHFDLYKLAAACEAK